MRLLAVTMRPEGGLLSPGSASKGTWSTQSCSPVQPGTGMWPWPEARIGTRPGAT